MTKQVKTFIEDNIDLIETESWESLFDSWYDAEIDMWWELSDAAMFEEMVTILKSSGINIDLDKRSLVMTRILEHELKLEMTNAHSFPNDFIGQGSILNRLNSYLGYTEEEVIQLMDRVAENLGLRTTEFYGKGYYIDK